MRFDSSPDARTAMASGQLVEIGLWIRLGLSGGMMAAASPFLVLAGDVPVGGAALACAAGTALAMFAWRRTKKLLGAADAGERAAAIVPAPAVRAHAA